MIAVFCFVIVGCFFWAAFVFFFFRALFLFFFFTVPPSDFCADPLLSNNFYLGVCVVPRFFFFSGFFHFPPP